LESCLKLAEAVLVSVLKPLGLIPALPELKKKTTKKNPVGHGGACL
jgi:hypothetical protein